MIAYALYHVSKVTGEAVRYPRDIFPAMPRAQAEREALESRIAKARGSSQPGEWETRALPDERKR